MMRISMSFAKIISAVPVGNLRSEILVVQSAQNWHRQRATDGLDSTRDRRVLLQRKVRPSLVVIFLVRIEQLAEMSFAEHNNMVKTIPSDRTMNIAATAASPRRSAITVRAMPRRQPSETCAARQRAVDHPRQGGK